MSKKEENNKRNSTCQVTEEEKNIKELLLSGGGGGMVFMMGYVHALVQIIGKEALKQYKLGGVSCGAIVAGLLHIVLYSENHNFKQFYKELAKPIFGKENRKYFGLFTSGKIMHKNAETFCKILQENPHIPSISGKVHCSISLVSLKPPFLKNKIVDEFESLQDYIEAFTSTCGVPFIVDFGFFQKWRGHKTLDGGFTGTIPYKYEDSEKVFLNILPEITTKFPVVLNQPKNLNVIQITEGTGMAFPTDYWIWDENWADQQFENGYQQAFRQNEILQKQFKVNQNMEKIQEIQPTQPQQI